MRKPSISSPLKLLMCHKTVVLLSLLLIGGLQAPVESLLPSIRLKLARANVARSYKSDRTPPWLRPQPPQQRRRNNNDISMGIRSMLGFGKKNRKEEEPTTPNNKKIDNTKIQKATTKKQRDKDSSSSPPSAAAAAVAAAKAKANAPTTTVSSSSSVPPMKPVPGPTSPLRMGEDPETKEVNVHALDQQESVQDRINRVKSGAMTEEEKRAFLQTALSAGSTAESRRPLRDPVPDDKRHVSASPFPSDSILRNFARGNGTTLSNRDISELAGLDSQKKKREYLEMVTNPDRFHQYKTAPSKSSSSGGGGGVVEPISGSVQASSKTPISDIRDMGLKQDEEEAAAAPATSLPSSATNVTTPTPEQQQPQTTTPTTPMPSDLGVRLGVAAMQTENERKEREQRLEMERREYDRRATEFARRRQEEITRFETEQQFRRRQEDENAKRAEEEKKRQEEERLQQLMVAQEEYWNQKLAKERESKAAKQAQQEISERNRETAERQARLARKAREVTAEEAPPTIFNPDESEILEEAEEEREEDWEENQEIIERSAARELGTAPHLGVVETEEDFMEEQARKKSKIDKMHDEQMERLKALNSPLPSHDEDHHHHQAPVFRPQKPAPSFRAPPSGNRPQKNLSGRTAPRRAATKTRVDDAVDRKSTIAELQQPKATSTDESSGRQESNNSQPAPPTKSLWSGFLGGSQKPTSETTTPNSGNSPSPPTQQKKGPIRMKLPLVDEESSEEDGIDTRSSKSGSMSIAEAMKKTTRGGTIGQEERSKKWGVDMSRFLNDE